MENSTFDTPGSQTLCNVNTNKEREKDKPKETWQVEIYRKPVRSARMRVIPDGTIEITAPDGFDTDAFIAKKKGWIAVKRAEYDQMTLPICTAPNQMILLGTAYTVMEGDDCETDHRKKTITAPNPPTLRWHLTNEFQERIYEDICDHAKKMGVSPNRLTIRMQKTRWGSCSSAENLNFNLRLYALPPHLKNYVVVHELAHLKVLNHSPAFWSFVAAHYPEYEHAEADLKRYWVTIERNHWWKAIQ